MLCTHAEGDGDLIASQASTLPDDHLSYKTLYTTLVRASNLIEMGINEVSHRQHVIIGITTAVLVLAIISYILRLAARRVSRAGFWYDDWFMGAGLVRENSHLIIHGHGAQRLITARFLPRYPVSAIMLVRIRRF